MKWLTFLVALCVSVVRAEDLPQQEMIIVIGAGGEQEYTTLFEKWATAWEDAAKLGGVKCSVIGRGKDDLAPGERLRQALKNAPQMGSEPLWVVFLGHGTATAGDAKFNLRESDLASSQMAELLGTIQRPLVLVGGFSTSGAWMKPLAGPNRVVVTATRSGSESNFARFGGHLGSALADPEADLDQDGQTSLLEAYISASRVTANWYSEQGRLVTEHPLLDDNGDGAGTPADWFKGVRAVKKPKEGKADGSRAHQLHLIRSKEEQALSGEARKRRDTLEAEMALLREKRADFSEAEYLAKLEAILLELARLYRSNPERR